jgi:hypothetical protein
MTNRLIRIEINASPSAFVEFKKQRCNPMVEVVSSAHLPPAFKQELPDRRLSVENVAHSFERRFTVRNHSANLDTIDKQQIRSAIQPGSRLR